MTTAEAPAVDWTERLLRLERRNQRLSGVVVLLLLVALVQTAWHLLPPPTEVFAKRFVLQAGHDGPPRGEFSLWKDGTPALRINNVYGEALALWAVRQDGTLSLRMNDARLAARVEMMVDPAGLPRVALYGADGQSRASLSVDGADLARLEGIQGR